MLDPRILQSIEACRPDSDDAERLPLGAQDSPSIDASSFGGDAAGRTLADELAANPEARRLWETRQAEDRRIASAVRSGEDFPLPEGLADRILARLQETESPPETIPTAARAAIETSSDAPSASEPAATRRTTARPTAPRRRGGKPAPLIQRLLLGTAAALAVALALRLFARQEEIPLADYLPHVQTAYEDTGPGTHDLRKLSRRYALPQSVRAKAVGWVETRVDGHTAVALDLVGPAGVTATLLMVEDRRVVGLPPHPPWQPQVTGVQTIGVWKSGAMVYALVVEGGVRDYQSFIRQRVVT